MQDRLLRRMQIVHTFGDVKGELLAVVPCHLDLHVVEQGPEGASGAVLKHNAQVRHASASS